MKNFLLYLWQAPQILVGWVWGLILGPIKYEESINGVRVVYSPRMRNGVSLGNVIYLDSAYLRYNGAVRIARDNIEKHEYGHIRQSRMLGWLYLPIVGIPSLIWCAIYRYTSVGRDYYGFYTEKWADRLGKVERR